MRDIPKLKIGGFKISTEVMVRMSRDQFRSCDMHARAYIEVRTLVIEVKGWFLRIIEDAASKITRNDARLNSWILEKL
jgi:hypothetical protein